jgi:hypothetical protein
MVAPVVFWCACQLSAVLAVVLCIDMCFADAKKVQRQPFLGTATAMNEYAQVMGQAHLPNKSPESGKAVWEAVKQRHDKAGQVLAAALCCLPPMLAHHVCKFQICPPSLSSASSARGLVAKQGLLKRLFLCRK